MRCALSLCFIRGLTRIADWCAKSVVRAVLYNAEEQVDSQELLCFGAGNGLPQGYRGVER